MITAPCKGCVAKGCGAFHSECEKYLEWQAQHNDARRKEQLYKSSHCGTTREAHVKTTPKFFKSK